MPKSVRSIDARDARRHNPLSEEYTPTTSLKQKASKKRKSRHDEDEEHFVDSKASRKILQLGQDLADEEEQERPKSITTGQNPLFSLRESPFQGDVVSEEETGGYEEEDDDWGDDEDEVVEEVEVDPQDLEMFNRFNPSFDHPILQPGGLDKPPIDEVEGDVRPDTYLADLILEKIAAAEAGGTGEQVAEGEFYEEEVSELPEKVVEVYSKIALLLSRYKSGPLPKPFKILPTLPLPTQKAILPLTRPGDWTPNAVYAATRLFISISATLAQSFLTHVLLPAVREDIREPKKSDAKFKLNVHLYSALKKSLYKPAAFFKGLLFPLVADGCTLQEAKIVSKALRDTSIPVLHSAAALQRLCEIAADQMMSDADAASAINFFIKTLIEKKYALPYKVVDALVFHFLRFRLTPMDVDEGRGGRGAQEDGKLPVIWHQGLLAFAQRYKNEITEDQREALLDLLLARGHKSIGPEVRRELLAGRGRGVPLPPRDEEMGDGGDDTMLVDA